MAASYSELSEALYCIPPDLPRDEWYRLAGALHHALGDAGFDLFDQWSQGADSYNANDVRSTWNTFRGGCKGRPLTERTLFRTAMKYGYQNHKKGFVKTNLKGPAIPMKKTTKGTAEKYWDKAHDCNSHPYAEKKDLDTIGLKKYKGYLLVPAYNAAGKMSSIQTIDKDGKKKFLQGCTMSGCWYTITGDDTIVVAEGWATAKSIQMATGYTVIVAFSSSGFMKIPPLLRKKYPQARIILAPDNDESQDAVKKATQAARKSGCEIIVPEVSDGSDFDDVRQAAGLDEVSRQFADNVTKPRLHDL